MEVNDPKVRALYKDLHSRFGVSAAWIRSRSRAFEDPTVPRNWTPRPTRAPFTKAAKAKLARVAGKAPEVMVKVSGRTRDSGHLKAHMEYITRNGKVTAETEYGRMKGMEAVNDLHADWSDDAIIYKGQHNVRKAPLSVNMVLSMPPGVDRERFRNAVRDFVDAEIKPRADVIVAFHDDTKHPHAHVTVRGRQHNGRAFNPGKAVLDQYRDRFAAALRARGIEAEATPRFARGRTRKADQQNMRHMRARGVTPYMDLSTGSEVRKEYRRGRDGGVRHQNQVAQPWETATRNRQFGVRSVYLATAQALAQSGNAADRQLARKVEQFVHSMPALEFQRDLYRQAFDKQIAEHERGRERDRTRDGRER